MLFACIIMKFRYVNKEENYAPYHDFRFKDYVQRTQIIKTYNVRFSDLHTAVAFDKDWVTAQLSDTEEEVPDPVSVKRKTKRVWDSDEEEWVHEDDTVCLPYAFVYVSTHKITCVLTQGIVDGDTPGASRSAKKTTVTPKSPRTPVMVCDTTSGVLALCCIRPDTHTLMQCPYACVHVSLHQHV